MNQPAGAGRQYTGLSCRLEIPTQFPPRKGRKALTGPCQGLQITVPEAFCGHMRERSAKGNSSVRTLNQRWHGGRPDCHTV